MSGTPASHHRVVLWSVSGVLAMLMAITSLWLVVYALQQADAANHRALVGDCTAAKVEHQAILKLIPKSASYRPEVVASFRSAEQKVCNFR